MGSLEAVAFFGWTLLHETGPAVVAAISGC